jgi:hypothetical protein
MSCCGVSSTQTNAVRARQRRVAAERIFHACDVRAIDSRDAPHLYLPRLRSFFARRRPIVARKMLVCIVSRTTSATSSASV